MSDLHSIEAEQSILGALLIDNNAIDRLGEMDETVFYTAAHKLIFTAIRRQSISSRAWDVITIAEMIESDGKLNAVGGLAYIGSLAQNVPSSANIGRYADIGVPRMRGDEPRTDNIHHARIGCSPHARG